MNKSFIKGMLFALLIVYVVSPADFLPGPIDDALAILIYLAANRKQLGLGGIEDKQEDAEEIEVLDTDGKRIL